MERGRIFGTRFPPLVLILLLAARGCPGRFCASRPCLGARSEQERFDHFRADVTRVCHGKGVPPGQRSLLGAFYHRVRGVGKVERDNRPATPTV